MKKSTVEKYSFSDLLMILFIGILPFQSIAQRGIGKNQNGYKNASLPIEERVLDVLSKMTLDEKVAQLQCIWSQKKKLILDSKGFFSDSIASHNFPNGLGSIARPNETLGNEYISKSLSPKETAILSNRIQRFFIEKTRLGIPVLFHEESLHGNQAKDATAFPSHLALGATWDEALLKEIYTTVAKEVRLRGARQVLAPVVDLGRDPRWGRTEETLGEDPYHVSRMAVAEIIGYQGNDKGLVDSNHVMATLKHFGVHGQPENGINISPAFYDERTLRETFFPPFENCIKAGALSVMPCYNELSGIPAHANKWLLTDLLRKEWGFKGIVTSDYTAIQDLNTIHCIAKDTLEAALLAINAGVDIETPYNYAFNSIKTLIKNGKLHLSVLNETVSRILKVKFMLGLFDHPYTNPEAAEKFIGCDANRNLALKAAEEAVVLLKNKNGTLPIKLGQTHSLAVIGPNADRCILGGYSDVPKHISTPLDGIKKIASKDFEILYAEGCKITQSGNWFTNKVELANPDDNKKLIAEAVETAKKAEIILLFVGGNEATSREAWSKGHHGDLSNLELIGQQNDLITALKALNKPIVAIVNSGPPLSFQHLDSSCDALLQAWYLGQEGGEAIANVIFGKVNPSAKLPISIARSAAHLPIYYNHKPSARVRSYAFDTSAALYPFGYGLSYTQFTIGDLSLNKTAIQANEKVTLSCSVKNVGTVSGTETMQVYIRDQFSSLTRPVKELKDFIRVNLLPGESKQINFEITPEKLSFYNISMKKIVEPGLFTIMVGNSSEQFKSIVLEVKE